MDIMVMMETFLPALERVKHMAHVLPQETLLDVV